MAQGVQKRLMNVRPLFLSHAQASPLIGPFGARFDYTADGRDNGKICFHNTSASKGLAMWSSPGQNELSTGGRNYQIWLGCRKRVLVEFCYLCFEDSSCDLACCIGSGGYG
jgi:hypothetical protein